MTLTVTAYRVSHDSGGEQICPIAGQSNLAGFEATRTTFYAGPISRRLGLVMLPRLATSDLSARGDELDALRAEVSRLMASLTAEEALYWQFRLTNILRAIDAASIYGSDGLVIID